MLTVPLLSDLDRRLFTVLFRLVEEVDEHCTTASGTGTRHRSPNLIRCSFLLTHRIDIIWAARQQAAYHTAHSRTPEADPVLLRTLQRRCFKRRTITASASTVFYAVRLGHVPRIYTSWRDTKPHTIGTLSDVKRFSTRKTAVEYMSKSMGPGDPLLDEPSAFIFTDGSALPNGSAGWEAHIIAETRAIWGPVSTSPTGNHWLGACRVTSNTGELSAVYHALDWIRKRR